MLSLLEPIVAKPIPETQDLHPGCPSILKQTDWPCGFYRIPAPNKVQYFNPALLDWVGTRWLIARRRRHAMHPGKNDIVFWRLRGGDEPINEFQVRFPVRFVDEHWEDPRAILLNGQPLISYSNFRTYWPHVHQAFATINPRFQATDYHMAYESNGLSLTNNTGNQKNWLWFDHAGSLHFIYSPSPHVVVKTSRSGVVEDYKTDGFTWKYGLPRGGTPPVFVEEDNLYWSFFHSSIDISPTPPRRRYYMGAYAFEAWPPFRVVMATMKPLLIGSGDDPREPSAPYCVFPCGALLDGDWWTISFGVNDCACAWIKIPHQEIRRLSYML